MMARSNISLFMYVSLWCFYELQALFGMTGGVVPLAVITILLLASFYYVAKVHFIKESLPVFIIALDLLLLMFTVYGVIYIYSDYAFTRSIVIDKPYNYLKAIYNSLLPIYFFYYHSRLGKLDEKTMKIFACLFFVVILLSFFERDLVPQSGMFLHEEERELATNNRGYAALCVFPLLCFFRHKRVFQYIGLIVVIALLLLGMKRGSILIGAICLTIYLYFMLKEESFRMKIISLLAILSILLFSFCVFYYMYQNNMYFNSRVEMTLMGDSSGRNVLYDTLWDYFFYKTDDFSFLLGGGANSTLSITTNYAHNDWLEIAVNQGVAGVVLFLFYWISFFYTLRMMKRNRTLFLPFLLLFVIYFTKTFFSMSYGAMYVYSTSALGYCLGSFYLQKQMSYEDGDCDSKLSV